MKATRIERLNELKLHPWYKGQLTKMSAGGTQFIERFLGQHGAEPIEQYAGRVMMIGVDLKTGLKDEKAVQEILLVLR